MSGIFGYLNAPSAEALARMDGAMAHWGPDGGGLWQDGRCSLGQRLLYNTPEARYERLPRWVAEARLAITAEARIDNREELCDHFAIPLAERPTTPDSELIVRAYLQWGEACPDHLLGDWSFAIWQPDERKLFLARDHHGNTSLLYWQEGERFAFAADPLALYAVGAPRRLNELYLAQVLISWFAYHGPQTIDLDIQRLPPAHAMTVTPQGTRIWRFWRLEDTPALHLPNREEYAAGLLAVYDQAVRCRLRSDRRVGVTLSGGLDSGSVTALAARALGEQGQRLAAFTAIPIYDTRQIVGSARFGDETPFAQAVAARWPNVDHYLLQSLGITPIAGMRRTLTVMPEPSHAAANHFWITDLLDQARSQGVGTLLTGQGGNATVSWTGAPALRSRFAAFRASGWKGGLRRSLPAWALRSLMAWRTRNQDWPDAALCADFARRIRLAQRWVEGIGEEITLPESWCSPQEKRCAIIQPGASRVGDLWARRAAAAGMEIRDPTFDKRVMVYTFSVPDPVFDSPDGGDRWLLRAALTGLLPDVVRLNQERGRQAADLVSRLRACQEETAAALAEVDALPASAYLDVPKMRRVWDDAQREVTARTTLRAGVVLMRGLLAGLFLNRAAS